MSRRAALLARARRVAEAGMVDRCTILRQTGMVTDPTTGRVTPVYDRIYPDPASGLVEGPCRIQELQGFARDTTPTPPDPTLMRYRILQLPVVSSPGIRQGDEVRITHAEHDPDLVGRIHIVRDQSGKSEATVRRLGIEEQT